MDINNVCYDLHQLVKILAVIIFFVIFISMFIMPPTDEPRP